MIERFLHRVRVERPDGAEGTAQARERLRERFSRTASRRMTHLGLLVGSVLDGLPLGPEDAVVYATTYAETRALEDYLGSFPAASPLLFQTSIHPSAIQQVLIQRQQPLGRLWPIAAGARLVEQALSAVLLETAPLTVLVGGEERGTWMLDYGMASPLAFALCISLTAESRGASGRLEFLPEETQGGDECPLLADLADALDGRKPLRWRGLEGRWSIQWL
jgi:hypothetical protein